MYIIDVTDRYPVTGLHWKLNVVGQENNEFGLGVYAVCDGEATGQRNRCY